VNTIDTAKATKALIVDLPSNFMLDGATYARGGELGYDGLDFYAAGRGGTLGAVDADVIAATFVFFNPTTVRDHWQRALAVGDPMVAGTAFAECAHAWGRMHLDDTTDHGRLADLLERVVAAANPAGAPLFAAWRALPTPSDAKARVIHFANALRELRGAMHGASILAHAVPAGVAVQTKSPHMAALFGWSEPTEGVSDYADAWAAADAATDVAFAPAFAALTVDERRELAELGAQAVAGAS
jgi:hypothetical protein